MLVSVPRDRERDITLSWARKPLQSTDLRPVDLHSIDRRRPEFLVCFSQAAGASLVPASLWGLALPARSFESRNEPGAFHLHPHYRSERPLDATLLKVQAGLDDFITEKYADQIDAILGEWSASLLQSPRESQAIVKSLAGDFSATSLRPSESRVVRSSSALEVRQNRFANQAALSRDEFLREWQTAFSGPSKILTAEFQITSIDVTGREAAASS